MTPRIAEQDSLERLIAELRNSGWVSQNTNEESDAPYRAADTLSQMAEALEECRLIVANLPHGEEMLLAKIDAALGVSRGR